MSRPESSQRAATRQIARNVAGAVMLRAHAVEIAERWIGCSADPADFWSRVEYESIVARDEPAPLAADMMHMSGCGLVAAGLWRALGVKHKLLAPPYQIGTALARLVEIGRQAGGIMYASPGLLPIPAPGDVVLVGAGQSEHVFVVARAWRQFGGGAEAGPVIRIESVDGGQRDERGHQTIARRERAWSVEHGAMWDRARPPGEAWGHGRVVQGWIDLLAVVGRFGAVAPGKEGG